jgi:hypothetical protein
MDQGLLLGIEGLAPPPPPPRQQKYQFGTRLAGMGIEPGSSLFPTAQCNHRIDNHSTSQIKAKVHHETGREGPEGELRHTSSLSLTSALDGCEWSTSSPGRFTPDKQTRYPPYRRLGGPQGRSGRVLRKMSPPPGFDPQTAQPVASRYTD